jgi:hypothetical protein
MDRYSEDQIMGLLKLSASGIVCLALGLVVILHPSLRSDPNKISPSDVAVGIGPILVGVFLLALVGLNLLALKRSPHQPPDALNDPRTDR